MAKNPFWLRGAKGKIAGSVVYQSKGKTVIRENVKPSNPQSNAQMAQRVIFSTVAGAAKGMAGIVNHSFEGVNYGSDSILYFRKLNLDLLREYAAVDFEEAPKPSDANVFLTAKGIKGIIPNSYIISDGSLAPSKMGIKHWRQNDDERLGLTFPTVTLALSGDGVKSVTLGDALKAILGLHGNNELLSLVTILQSAQGYKYSFAGDTAPGFQIPYTVMNAVRAYVGAGVDLNTDIAVTDAQGALLNTAVGAISEAIETAFNASPKTDTFFSNIIATMMVEVYTATLENGALTLTADNDETLPLSNYYADSEGNGFVFAAGVVRSKLDNGSWLRSRSQLVRVTPQAGLHNYGIILYQAIESWFASSQIVENTHYLNAGTDENTLGESFQ